MTRGGGGGGKVLSFILGLLLGIIILAGSLFGAGYFLYSNRLDKTVKTVDKFLPNDLYAAFFGSEDKEGYLSEEYASKKVSELLNDIRKAASALSGEGCLQNLDDISPKVGTMISGLLDSFTSFGITVNHEEFMATPVNELSDFLANTIQGAPLASMMESMDDGKPVSDPIMLAICYGSPTHYATDEKGKPILGEDGKPIMNQIVYTYEDKGEGAKLYDIDGNVVEGYVEGADTVTVNEVTYYLSETTATPPAKKYLAFTDEAKTEKACYPITKVKDLAASASSLVDGLYLSDALNVNNASHKVLIALAYGSEENYTVKDDGTILPKEGFTPRTIGQLKRENTELINGIYMKDALNITPTSHPILISLAYGQKDKDYELVQTGVDAQNKPVYKIEPINEPRTIGDLSNDSTNLINGVYMKDALNITPTSHPVLISLAYGSDYTIDGETISCKPGNTPRTIGDLSNDSTNLINGVYMKDALNVTPSSHQILISLAYGQKDKDYELVQTGVDAQNKPVYKIEPINEPRTIGDLSNNSTELIESVLLSDVLKEDQKSAISMYMLYGRKGIHYKLTQTGTDDKGDPVYKTELLQKRILKIEGSTQAYDGYGEPISGHTIDGTYYTVSTDPLTRYTVIDSGLTQQIKIEEGGVKVEKTAKVYYYQDEAGDVVYYQAATLGEMMHGDKISKITQRLTVSELMNSSELDSNMFLKHVKDKTIDELPSAVSNLTIISVYEEQIYKTYEEDTPYTDSEGHQVNKGDYIDASGNFVCTKAELENLDETKKEDLVLKGTWKYLLTNPADGKVTDCKITDMDTLVSNMQKNMQKATLNELNADGIVSLTSDTLGKELMTDISVTILGETKSVAIPFPSTATGKKTLGQLTVSEMLTYIGNVLQAVDDFKKLVNPPANP